jgi:hypothetical protein
MIQRFLKLNSKFGGVIQITIYSHMAYNACKKKREKEAVAVLHAASM